MTLPLLWQFVLFLWSATHDAAMLQVQKCFLCLKFIFLLHWLVGGFFCDYLVYEQLLPFSAFYWSSSFLSHLSSACLCYSAMNPLLDLVLLARFSRDCTTKALFCSKHRCCIVHSSQLVCALFLSLSHNSTGASFISDYIGKSISLTGFLFLFLPWCPWSLLWFGC